MSVPVRAVGLLALAATLPVTMFFIGSLQYDPTSAVLTMTNVVLITISLLLLFGPAPADETHENGAAH